MRKFLIIPAFALALGASGFAFASDDDARIDAPRAEWLSIAEVTAKFTAEGYDVRQVKEEDGGYEIYALKDGKRLEAVVNPVTGEILNTETDD